MAKQFQIIYMNPADLVPYVNNAKLHEIDKIEGSIEEFGFDVPIVVDKHRVIIKGHGRREAAINRGRDLVPVIVRDDLSPAKVKLSRHADNRSAAGGYDEELRRLDFQAMLEEGLDLSLTAYDPDEIDGFLQEPEINPDDGAWQEGNPVIKYEIIFEDELQQNAWFAFLKHLQGNYLNFLTIGARIKKYVEDSGIATG